MAPMVAFQEEPEAAQKTSAPGVATPTTDIRQPQPRTAEGQSAGVAGVAGVASSALSTVILSGFRGLSTILFGVEQRITPAVVAPSTDGANADAIADARTSTTTQVTLPFTKISNKEYFIATVGVGIPSVYLFTGVFWGMAWWCRWLLAVSIGMIIVGPPLALRHCPEPSKQVLSRRILQGFLVVGIVSQIAAAIASANMTKFAANLVASSGDSTADSSKVCGTRDCEAAYPVTSNVQRNILCQAACLCKNACNECCETNLNSAISNWGGCGDFKSC